MRLFIVTGASKGLGKALLRQLMRPGHRLVGLARGEGGGLLDEAAERGVPLEWISCDLSDVRRLETVMREALRAWAAAQTAAAKEAAAKGPAEAAKATEATEAASPTP